VSRPAKRPDSEDSASQLSVSAENAEYAGRPGTMVRLAGRAAGAANQSRHSQAGHDAVACLPQPHVERMLLLAGTDRLIPLFGSVEEAMAG
jgi:hypothetical protein